MKSLRRIRRAMGDTYSSASYGLGHTAYNHVGLGDRSVYQVVRDAADRVRGISVTPINPGVTVTPIHPGMSVTPIGAADGAGDVGILDYAAIPGNTILGLLGIPRTAYDGLPPPPAVITVAQNDAARTQANLVEIGVGIGVGYLAYRLLFKRKAS
jgi:hypothetical protein